MTQPVVALKIDVDTYVGTRDGVPVLLDLLARHNAKGTFYFCLGPDHTGRALRRIFTHKGFTAKGAAFRTHHRHTASRPCCTAC